MAVADELRASGAEVSFLGTRDRMEAELVPAAGYEIDFVKVRGIDRRNPLKAARAGAEAIGAVAAARKVLRRRGADVVLGGGGFVAGPAGLAAALTRTPLVLTEADSHLGLANRLLAGRARRVCLAFPIAGREGEPYLVIGRPVPKAVLEGDRAKARERFGVPADARCLLVFGGSQGARTINFAAVEAFAENVNLVLPGMRGEIGSQSFHIVHVAGKRDYPEIKRRLAAAPGNERYTLLEYEPNLGDALAASDLVLARSGGSIFEVVAAGRPAILVPFPFATADHQSANAEWMRSGGAATVIPDAELTAKRLGAEVVAVLGDKARLEAMATAARKLAKPDAARQIADEVLKAADAAKSPPQGEFLRSREGGAL
ncbi:MAG TPA: UDP-N-acetylglucosamine--N-acetylmuramyl-(pentapeptide) pyrophosphoryl-undecaprenol N-acetylglucosamine transferase [Solirubrobacterales bacterium]|nr:UDP-N-acetylglucosamine--N-acetylmuramyl-(pentapeptide) pyrophosphoryl-undecaprenol N-acetylglucosamine transferase [Solirubrobacterales bacterium]